MTLTKPLDLFTYIAIMKKIDKLKTLKAKEELIRNILLPIKSINKLDYIYNYKCYSRLLNYEYPDAINKLPQFLTTKKDNFAKGLLLKCINDNIEYSKLIDIFEFTKIVYLPINNLDILIDLNKICKNNKLNFKLLIKYTNPRTSQFYLQRLKRVPKLTSCKSLRTSTNWEMNTYTEFANNYSIEFYFDLILDRYKLSSDIYYPQWDGFIDELSLPDKQALLSVINTVDNNTATSLKYLKELK